MAINQVEITGLPIGYRFLPSPDVLMRNYLTNKNLNRALPANVIPEIHADRLFTVPPHQLVANTVCTIEDEWYFFVYADSYFRGEKKKEHAVGNGDGFWRGDNDENPILDTESKDTKGVLGFKTCHDYFVGPVSNPEKTEWKLEKYRLPYNCDEASKVQKEGWVIARIIKGAGFVFTE